MSDGWKVDFIPGKEASYLSALVKDDAGVVCITNPSGDIYWFISDSTVANGVLGGETDFYDHGANGQVLTFSPPPEIIKRIIDYLVCYEVIYK